MRYDEPWIGARARHLAGSVAIAAALLLVAWPRAAAPAEGVGAPPEGPAAPASGAAVPVDRADEIAHGRYLVYDVAMCVECHTPRDEAGTLLLSRALHGARIEVASPYSRLPFAYESPSLVGLPAGYDRDDLVRFLSSGEVPHPHPPRAPMPSYRMTEADASAVAAYLATLGRPEPAAGAR